jgi:hypothetical protein
MVFITLGEPQAHGDTAEALPFRGRVFSAACLAAQVRFFPANITDESRKGVPQGLKRDVFSIVYGTTEVVP